MDNRLLRLFKHRRFDAGDARRMVGTEALKRIEASVANSETHHSGQIRVCIEGGLPLSYLARGAGVRERALMMFGKLRVWDTEHNNGVLIYLLLAERSIELVADRGLAGRVEAARWQSITAKMSSAFREESIEAGLKSAVDAVDELLTRFFPLAPGEVHVNELPDAPYTR